MFGCRARSLPSCPLLLIFYTSKHHLIFLCILSCWLGPTSIPCQRKTTSSSVVCPFDNHPPLHSPGHLFKYGAAQGPAVLHSTTHLRVAVQTPISPGLGSFAETSGRSAQGATSASNSPRNSERRSCFASHEARQGCSHPRIPAPLASPSDLSALSSSTTAPGGVRVSFFLLAPPLPAGRVARL